VSDLFYGGGGYYDSGYFLFKNILKLYIYIYIYIYIKKITFIINTLKQ
jgi:hypothetical protein